MNIAALFVCFLAVGAPAVQAWAADDDTLRFFEEEARVVTASRRAEFVRQAPAAVDIITAEDIRDSGAVNLWDLMRFRAGMNVLDARSGEGNRAIVSVRGFPQEFVDNLLVLVDGRSVYTALSGGAVWEYIPVQLQDLERIEIVRGPNAALFGSNAGLGVINIITKKPQARPSASAGAAGGNLGAHREQASVEDGGFWGAGRLSFTHKAQDGHPTPAGPAGNDFLFSNKGNARGSWAPTERSTLELFAGGAWDTQGVVDAANPQGRFRHHFQMLKYGFAQSPASSIEVTLARRDDLRTYDPLFINPLAVREYQYDAEALHSLDWMDERMHTVYGGNFRYNGEESAGIFAGRPRQKNAVKRGFASQSWQAAPALTLVGAVSLERSDTGGTEPAYQAAAVVAPAADHTFRLSHGLAPTIPTLYQAAANQLASPAVLLLGNPGMRSQELRSYEASYQGAFLDRRMRVETNLFYLDIRRLSETIVQSFVFAPAPLLTLSFDNGNNAVARGAELKWSYRWNAERSAYANYTYESISDAKGKANVRKGTPPHKFNLGGSSALFGGLSLGLNAGYQDGHTLSSQATGKTLDIPEYWRLDGRLAYRPTRDVEVFFSCQNMTQARHVEFPEGLAVPRTYSGGVLIAF